VPLMHLFGGAHSKSRRKMNKLCGLINKVEA
jgi:hypothetical protein